MGLCAASIVASSAARGGEIDFDRDVRPILADRCYPCHGPDQRARQADLRLDIRDQAFAEHDGHAAFVPGDAARSEAIERIFSDDDDVRMPPPDSKLVLTSPQKELLRRWVLAGAPWADHWAFVAPVSPAVPEVGDASWCRNDVDYFVLQKLAAAGLQPAPEADKRTLVRRLYLDLLGLPPSPAEVDAFLRDSTPDAYERLADRLLESDACAERLALDWLDLARYADSHGLHADGARRMWPWRDWVISAFRRNLPYDKFVTWQLAGDLLPAATDEQRLATAFLRNHAMTAEGGVIDEEVRLNYVFDRVETVSTAFLGLTIGCARCHDHKFDPFTQREYYQMAAFFNNVRELGMTGDDGDFGPLLPLPDDNAKRELEKLAADLAQAADERDQVRQLARAEFDENADRAGESATLKAFLPPLSEATVFPLDAVEEFKTDDQTRFRLDGNESATTAMAPKMIEGISGKAIDISGDFGYLELKGVGLFDVAEPFSAAAWVRPNAPAADAPRKNRVVLGTGGNKNQFWRGWELFIDETGHLAVWLVHARPDNLVHVRTKATVDDGRWTHVAFSYDGTGRAAGIRLFIDGKPAESIVVDDQLNRTIFPAQAAPGYPRDEKRAVRAGRSYRAFGGDFGIYQGALDDLRLYRVALTDLEAAALFEQYGRAKLTDDAVDAHAADARFEHWLRRDHTAWQTADAQYRKLLAKRVELSSEIPVLMVMKDMDQRRQTYVLERGEYDRPREPVECATPKAVLPWSADRPQNRLGLAEWLFDPANPLTARVAVNRYWQMLFGQGLVRTTHDFGNQGERPTHPELLDWLAVSFRQSGWDVHALLRQIVTSSTYRQSSSGVEWREHERDLLAASAKSDATIPDPAALDPGNRLLWRGASYRLSAEIIRDSALAASGLLVPKVGGPSVKPYQPAGLWTEKNNFSQDLADYVQDTGDALYRRSLYTFVRRTSPPPSMITFDATDRSTCTVKRETTNTPLQALVLFNDPQFVEAARVLAERVQLPAGKSDQECLGDIFLALTGREECDQDVAAVKRLFDESLDRYAKDPDSAKALLSVGEHPCEPGLDTARTAAMTIVANTIMNFDDFYMRR